MNTEAAYPDHINAHERTVIDALIKDALSMGCTVSVCDGEEWPIKRSTDYKAITAEVAASDETTIRVRNDDSVATFNFVHGNLPSEVLCDMTDTPFARKIYARAEDVALDLERRGL